MYLLDGKVGPLKIDPVGYTYNQLQKVSTQEYAQAPIFEEEEERYEVQKIVDRRKKGNSFEYFIKWKNLRKNYNTWEKRKELVKDLGVAYMQRIDKQFDSKLAK